MERLKHASITTMRWNVVAAAIILFGAGVVAFVQRSHTVYATPETQSRFFKTFSVERTLDPFIDSSVPHAMAFGGPSSSGTEFATHRTSIEPRFRLKGDEASLLTAIRKHVDVELVRNGGRVIRDEIDPSRKTKIQYILGQIQGTVTIFPLAPLEEPYSLLMVQIEEQWRPLK